jgi:hypothetical protein
MTEGQKKKRVRKPNRVPAPGYDRLFNSPLLNRMAYHVAWTPVEPAPSGPLGNLTRR